MIAIFLLAFASAVVGYIVAGYPLILAMWRGRRAPAVAKDLAFRPSVSLLLAVHDGEKVILPKLQSIAGLDYPRDHLQILVISDGSTDRTEDLVRDFGDPRVELVAVPRGGKAAALNAGFAR